MLQRAKKRIGRPPGRKAPHRPVLSQRVPQELYDVIKDAGRASGRTMGEEMVWRVERSFEWEKAFGDARAVMTEGRKAIAGELQAKLRADGYQVVRGSGGNAWFEPGVNPSTWIVDSLDQGVLEELLARAAARGVKLALQGKGELQASAETIRATEGEKP
jgi:hypothetical protein